MDFGALWKNKDDNGLNGRVKFDADIVLKAGVDYNLFVNLNDKKGVPNAPDFRLNLKQK